MIQIATPVSNFFTDETLRNELIEISDILELRDNNPPLPTNKRYLYHSPLNLLAVWLPEEITRLRTIQNEYVIKAVSSHIMYRYQNIKIKKGQKTEYAEGIGTPLSIDEMKKNAQNNCKILKNIFGKNIIILGENINDLLTDAYEIVTNPSFISEIIRKNDIYFLLDISHALISSINKKIDFEQYLSGLPLDKCKQVHISKHVVVDGFAIDAHEALHETDWILIKNIMKRLDKLEYATIEYYRNEEIFIEQISKLREIIEEIE